MTPPKAGRLDQATVRAGGRNIDTWTYRSGLPGQSAIEVKVNLVSNSDGRYTFTASSPVFRPALEHADLNELRRLVDESLHLHCTDLSGLVWVDWLEVQVVGQSRNRNDDQFMSLSISYKTLKRAVLADGKAVTVATGGRIVPFPTAHQAGPQLDPGMLILDDRHPGAEISYIPSTPEALQALADLQARLDQLRFSLSTLLTQSSIADQLLRLASGPLSLPKPEDGVTA